VGSEEALSTSRTGSFGVFYFHILISLKRSYELGETDSISQNASFEFRLALRRRKNSSKLFVPLAAVRGLINVANIFVV